MSTIIKFQNEFGHEITQDQINNGLSYYSKVFYENGKPTIEETYNYGELVNTSKYVSNEMEIVNELAMNPNSTFDYIYYDNGFKLHEIRSYQNNILIDKVLKVYDSSNKMICYRDYEIEDGNILSYVTEKKYYDENENLLYSFDYNENGSCFLISNEQEGQADVYAWSVGEPGVSFIWQGFDYYQNADPVIPY
jgi:hypothetical protein